MAKGNKYHAKKVHADGLTFDSQAEHRRYCSLKLLARAKHIAGLRVHPHFDLYGMNGGKILRGFTADFAYDELGADGMVLARVVEDVKSPPTRKLGDYRLRKALFIDNYPGVDFREIA